MPKGLVVLGDKTTHGGNVISASASGGGGGQWMNTLFSMQKLNRVRNSGKPGPGGISLFSGAVSCCRMNKKIAGVWCSTGKILTRMLHQAADRERDLLLSETAHPAGSTITIDGQTYQVEHSPPAVGQALYLSLQSQQWPEAQRLAVQL